MAKLTSNSIIVPSPYKDDTPATILLFEGWRALHAPITEVEGATVGTLVEILKGDVDLYSRVLDCPNLEAFLEEPCDKPDDKLRHVEFHTYIERWAGDKKWNHKDGDLEILFGMSGIGDADAHDVEVGIPAGSQVSYALDFSPLSSLLHLPIVVNGQVEMLNNQRISRRKTEYTRTVIGNFHMKLFEILYALVDEIGFHGSPEARSGRLGEIQERMDEVKRGEVETIPWEEVRERLEKKLEDEEEEDDEEVKDAVDEQ